MKLNEKRHGSHWKTSPKLHLRMVIERYIVEAIVDRALDTQLWAISVSSDIYSRDWDRDWDLKKSKDREAILDAAFASDDCHLGMHTVGAGVESVIQLTYGNDGYDVISDYHVSLAEFLKPIHELADKIGEGDFEIMLKVGDKDAR